MKTKKQKKDKPVKCTYCKKKDFYIYKRDKTRKIIWAICQPCLKKVCDSILGEGKDGGRVAE